MASSWAKAEPEWGDLTSVDAPASASLVITLARPNAGFLETLAATGVSTPEAPLLAGPFRLTELTDDEMRFEAFPGYWNGAPAVAGLRARFYPSARNAWAAFLRQEEDLLYTVPPEAVPLLERDPDVQLFDSSNQRYVIALGFQQRHAVLRDVRVRRALSLAIDRDEIMRHFFPTTALSERGPFQAQYWATQGEPPLSRFDPVEAQALLAPITADGRKPLELECITSNEFEPVPDIAAAIEVQLRRVHVRMTLVGLPRKELLRRRAKGEFELFAMPVLTSAGPNAPYRFWHSGVQDGPLDSGYTAADAALDALRRARSREAEQVAAHNVLEVMRRDPPAAFIGPQAILRATHRRWKIPPGQAASKDALVKWTLMPSAACADQ